MVTSGFLNDFALWNSQHELTEKLTELSGILACASDSDESVSVDAMQAVNSVKKQALAGELAALEKSIQEAKDRNAELCLVLAAKRDHVGELNEMTRHLKSTTLKEAIETLTSIQ